MLSILVDIYVLRKILFKAQKEVRAVDFGEEFETLRKQKGLTTQKLAAKADLGLPTLARVRKGDRSVGLETLDKAAAGLDMVVVIKLVPKAEAAGTS